MEKTISRFILLLLAVAPLLAGALVSVGGQPPDKPYHKVVLPFLPQEHSTRYSRQGNKLAERIALDDDGGLLLDGQTAGALSTAASSLPDDLTEAERQNLNRLIRNSVPGPAGLALTDLLARFQSYQHDQARMGPEEQTAWDPEILEQTIELQTKHFGEEGARLLFQHENTMRRAMMEQRMKAADADS